jgi:phage terminase small subunit
MPKKGGVFTPQERKVAEVYARTGDQLYAAAKAGLSQGGASLALARPAVQQEVTRLQLQRLFDDVLPLAVDVHIDLLRNAATPAGARVQAVKLAYERTLALGEALGDKDPSEMTGAELAEAIQKLKRLASDKARLVLEGEVTEVKPAGDVFG